MSGIYAHASTLQCFRLGCTPCAYKLCVYPGPYARQNERPELCLRYEQTQQEQTIKNGSDDHIGIYQNGDHILTVGDGNFSFSVALSNQFGSDIIATSFESLISLKSTYPDIDENLKHLKSNGIKYFHNVDATDLQKCKNLKGKKFDKIVWNFPCFASETGADAQVEMFEVNKKLVQGFMISAQEYLTPVGEIHITHKTKPPFGNWDIAAWGAELQDGQALQLVNTVVFDRVNYPGYINKKAKHKSSFPMFDAEQYIFIPKGQVSGKTFKTVHYSAISTSTTDSSSELGPIPLELIAKSERKMNALKIKKMKFQSVNCDFGSSKKRRRDSLDDVDSGDEGLFEYEDDDSTKDFHTAVCGSSTPTRPTNSLVPSWDALKVTHKPFELVLLTQEMLKRIRLTLIDRKKLDKDRLNLDSYREMVDSLDSNRRTKLIGFTPATKKNKKLKRDTGHTKKQASNNAYAILMDGDTESSDSE